MQLNFHTDLDVISLMWLKKELMSSQSLKMPGILTNIECLLVSLVLKTSALIDCVFKSFALSTCSIN